MTPGEKRAATAKLKRQRQEERRQEREKIRAALLTVINDDTATPGEKVEAARLLLEYENQYY